MNFATNDSKLKLINTNAINLIKSNNISTNYDSNLALYKNPIKRSSISVINSGKPNDAQFTSNQPMNQVQAQIAQNVPVQLINNQQNAINNSLLSYSKTSTSHNSLSSVTTKFKSKQSPSKESKIRELLFEDPRYRAKQLKKQRKQDIQKRFNDLNAPSYQLHNKIHQEHKRNFEEDYKVPHCHMTFVFDPNGRLSYWMGFIVSLAFLYNFWVLIYRYSFNEVNSKNKLYWFAFDYFADFLYVCDILFNFRTGFLEEGVLQTDPIRLRHHYMNTTRFYVDCLCLMPLDILYLSIGYNSILRCFRLVKIYRFWTFLDRTERHTNFPNVFRTVAMLHYLFAIFHWNACFSYFLSRFLSDDLMLKNSNIPPSPVSGYYSNNNNNLFLNNEFNSFSKQYMSDDNRIKNKFKTGDQASINDVDLLKEYLKAFYLSTKIMTMINEIPNPRTSRDYLFAICQLIFALLLFATIMGHVGYIVSNLGNARKEFQSKLDAVKTYMSLRRVPQRLQDRVIRWFDFLWTNHKSIDDNQVLSLLPYKLRAEIAIHVHLDTLKRVEIFQNTEAGFLNELVLRLKPVLYSPGDFICRKGEVGKEMYIVNGGKLQVISDNGKIVLATLKAGSYFGEISILNMGASGNRRTASVKSVGYSDLFCLSKEDLWEVLKEYPAVRVKLEAIAVKRLEKHKKPLTELVNMKRCKSAPGLIQASQANQQINIIHKRYGTLPISLLKRTDISYLSTAKTKESTQKKSDLNKFVSNAKKDLAILPKPGKITELSSANQTVTTINEDKEKSSVFETEKGEEENSFEQISEKKKNVNSNLNQSTPTSITSNMLKSISVNSPSNINSSYFDDFRSLTEKNENLNSKTGNLQKLYCNNQQLNEPSNIQKMIVDIEKYKKTIQLLETENSTLYLKLNNQKTQNLSSSKKNTDELNLNVSTIKAKPETDSDEYKV